MPSGPAHLHEKFGDDGTAWAVLAAAGLTHNKGVILVPEGADLSDHELDALEYLVLEWDWDIFRKAEL